MGSATGRDRTSERRRPGHPGLPHEELVYRLAKAQQAEEIRGQHPSMFWKEIARAIEWKHGSRPGGVKLLEDARRRLKGASPELKAEVAQYRKEKKET